MAGSTLKSLRTNDELPSPRTPGPAGIGRDASDPATPRGFIGDTPGTLGVNDYADPDSSMCRLRTVTASGMLAPTLGDARRGTVQAFHFENLELMSVNQFRSMPSDAERRDWVQRKLGQYEYQFYESAKEHQIPVQLLAVIISNELIDINNGDIAQEGASYLWWGSFGIAQIQISTALEHHLVPEDFSFQMAELFSMERFYVKGHLKVPQYAIDAAAKEIRILLDGVAANPKSAWVSRFGFESSVIKTNDDIYQGFPNGSQMEKEEKLAEMVAAAYNSPDIIKAKHPERYNNGPIHGQNAADVARDFYRWNLFRPECP